MLKLTSLDDVEAFCGHIKLGLENVASYPVIWVKDYQYTAIHHTYKSTKDYH